MKKMYSKNEKTRDAFFVLGSQYYALARYCADQFYLPVGITLFHHAIELLLKGYLSESKTSYQLKRIGHNLENLWGLFRDIFQDNTLNKYDNAIHRLNQVEDLRYPDLIVEEGYVLNVRLGTPIPLHLPGTETLPRYDIDVSALDEIVSAIFSLGNIPTTPYFKNTPIELQNTLPYSLRPN